MFLLLLDDLIYYLDSLYDLPFTNVSDIQVEFKFCIVSYVLCDLLNIVLSKFEHSIEQLAIELVRSKTGFVLFING